MKQPKKHIPTRVVLGRNVVLFLTSLPLGTKIIAKAMTNSMAPTIQIGQEIYIERVSPRQIKIGDIIGYTRGGKRNILVHRVTGKMMRGRSVWFTTKGDNSIHQDPYKTPQEFVLGLAYPLTK